MLCHLLGCDRLRLYLGGPSQVTSHLLDRLDEIIARRVTRYPLQYILGEAWFYGRRFFVDERVKIPTPETEILCEAAIRFVGSVGLGAPRIIDLGVGSGVIAVTLASELPSCRVLAVDLSSAVIEVARRNAADLGGAKRIEFLQSDFFAAVPRNTRFDLVLSNPPYISQDAYRALPPEVLTEPPEALLAGPTGLDAIQVILTQAPGFVAAGGRILFEIGCDQATSIREAVTMDSRYSSLEVIKDLNGLDRVVMLGCH